MPTPSTEQTQMNLWKGRAPAVDGDGFIVDISYKRRIVAKTTDYTVTAVESGTLFTTEGATADVNFTLPANADGLEFWFANAEDVELKVTADTADTIICSGDVAADSVAFSGATEQIGTAMVFIADGSKWFCLMMPGNSGSNPAAATIVTA